MLYTKYYTRRTKMDESTYRRQLKKDQTIQLRQILDELPPYVKAFFRSIEEATQPRTRIGYAYDIKYFFEYKKL